MISPTPSPFAPKRILVVEDHLIVQDGLRAILGTFPNEFTIVATAASSAEALRLTSRLKPDLILLDYFLGDSGDGALLVADLIKQSSTSKILVLSLNREDDVAVRALRAGAHGYVMKTHGAERLLEAIRVVLSGRRYASPKLLATLLEIVTENGTPEHSLVRDLSDRELQVFQLLGSGLSITDVAGCLKIAPKTASTHRENIKNKLNCTTADELQRLACVWIGRASRAYSSR